MANRTKLGTSKVVSSWESRLVIQGNERLPKKPEVPGLIFSKVSWHIYLDSIITDVFGPDAAVNENVAKAKRTFIHIRPFFRSSNLSILLKAKLAELLMEPTVTYGLSEIALRIKDNSWELDPCYSTEWQIQESLRRLRMHRSGSCNLGKMQKMLGRKSLVKEPTIKPEQKNEAYTSRLRQKTAQSNRIRYTNCRRIFSTKKSISWQLRQDHA